MVLVSLNFKPPLNCYIGLDEEGYDPNVGVDVGASTCTFETSHINKLSQLTQLKERLDQPMDDLVMQDYCSYETTECSEKLGSKCSRIHAGECSEWVAGQPTKVEDKVITNYCRKFPNNIDCKCVNRLYDPIYKQTKSTNQYNDGCWYADCATKEFLKTSDVNTSNCPSSICQIIYDLNKNNDVIIQNNDHKINCDFTSSDIKKGDTTINSIALTIEQVLTYAIPLLLITSFITAIFVYILQGYRRRK